MGELLEKIHTEILQHELENVENITHLLVTEATLFIILSEYAAQFDYDFPSKKLIEQLMELKIIVVDEVTEGEGYELLKIVKSRI